jgi:TolB-like protein/tetratricopeptide (TPR) repeat protein
MTSIGDREKKSVAILPFRNLTNDPAMSFYEFSLADAVITELARVRSLVVRSSSFIAKYLGTSMDPRDVGRELSVTAVLAASFLKAGDRLRVTAQLLDVESGNILWSDRMDATTEDIIALQDNISRHIVDGLRIELSSDEEKVMAGPSTGNAAAYEEYLRGRDFMGRYIYHTLAKEDVDGAIAHFERAIELDPDFALAHAALGGCYANMVIKGQGDAADYDRAEAAFDRGLALDPNILEARMHRVFILLTRGHKQRAREEVSRLSYEAPNDVGVAFVKAYLYRLDGEYEKALRALDRMQRLNPAERVVVSYNRARIFLYQGRIDDALLELDQGSAVEPDHPLIKTFRALAMFRKGDPETAVELYKEVLDSHPEMDGIRPLYAEALCALGDAEAARAQLTERVKEVAAADHDAPYWLASAYVMLGEYDEALNWLETAVNLGNENLPWFESNPLWEPLRTDPRFLNLMKRIEGGRQQHAEQY